MRKIAIILGLVFVASFTTTMNAESTIVSAIVTEINNDCDKCGKADCDGKCEKKEEKKECTHAEKKECSKEGEAKKACCSKDATEKKACCAKKVKSEHSETESHDE